MITNYRDLIFKAISIAKDFYSEKGLQHVYRVTLYAIQNETIPNNRKDFCIVLALLHDLLEDTEITESELSVFGDRMIECVKLITQAEEYEEYCERINKNAGHYPEVYWVKLADMKDHLSQRATLGDKLKEKYLKGLAYLL